MTYTLQNSQTLHAAFLGYSVFFSVEHKKKFYSPAEMGLDRRPGSSKVVRYCSFLFIYSLSSFCLQIENTIIISRNISVKLKSGSEFVFRAIS